MSRHDEVFDTSEYSPEEQAAERLENALPENSNAKAETDGLPETEPDCTEELDTADFEENCDENEQDCAELKSRLEDQKKTIEAFEKRLRQMRGKLSDQRKELWTEHERANNLEGELECERINRESITNMLKSAEKETRTAKEQYEKLLQLLPKNSEGEPCLDIVLSAEEELAGRDTTIKNLLQTIQRYKEEWWSPAEQDRYIKIQSEYEEFKRNSVQKEKELFERLGRLEKENNELAMLSREASDYKARANKAEQLYKDFCNEIERLNAYYRKEKHGKFISLKNYKENLSAETEIIKKTGYSLREIAQYVRQYGLRGEYFGIRLRYSEEMICEFLASLSASLDRSRLILLQGLSGTGKSSLPQLFAKALGIDSEIVFVQPSWRDRNDLLGFDNDFTGVFKETTFTRAIVRAMNDRQRIHFILLDECNLARVEYYFADFLSVLENPNSNAWLIELAQTDPNDLTKEFQQIRVPENLWFIGTANIDESTQSITDKVYDRAQVLNFEEVCGEEAASVLLKMPGIENGIGYNELSELFDRACKNPDYQLDSEQNEFLHKILVSLRQLNLAFGARIEAQLDKYIPVFAAAHTDPKRGKLVALDIFLANKVLCKLNKRFSYSAAEKDILETLEIQLEDEFGKDSRSYRIIETFVKKYGDD